MSAPSRQRRKLLAEDLTEPAGDVGTVEIAPGVEQAEELLSQRAIGRKRAARGQQAAVAAASADQDALASGAAAGAPVRRHTRAAAAAAAAAALAAGALAAGVLLGPASHPLPAPTTACDATVAHRHVDAQQEPQQTKAADVEAAAQADGTGAGPADRPACHGRHRQQGRSKAQGTQGRRRAAAAASTAATAASEPAAAPDEVQVTQQGKRLLKPGVQEGGATREMEQQLWSQGYRCVVGVDEAGRGPLAGPVVAAACCIPAQVHIPGVADSKQLSEEQREELYTAITQAPGVTWAVCVVDHVVIDRLNILQATLKAMREATQQVVGPAAPEGAAPGAHYLLVDGNRLPQDLPSQARAVVKGDARCYCIAAASILAKVTRDRLMLAYHQQFPHYGFDKHKGYGTPAHCQALTAHGPCEIHRRSFEPVKGMTGWTRAAQLAQEQAVAAAAAATASSLNGAPAADDNATAAEHVAEEHAPAGVDATVEVVVAGKAHKPAARKRQRQQG